MSTIMTRSGKGTPLTHDEVDANFTNLNTDKIQSGATVPVLNISSGNVTANITSSNATITGGTINNTTVGATTPTTGKFTTLTTTGNVGIGTSSPSVPLQVNSASLAAIQANITSSTGNVARFQLVSPTSNYGIYVPDNFNYLSIYDYNASSERMRIDANGNLGIGTSSPSFKLDVNTGIVGIGPKAALSGQSGLLALRDDTATVRWYAGILNQTSQTRYSIYDAVANLERLTIDSAGNLGLGVTPSAWTAYTALQLPGGAISGTSSSNRFEVLQNAYYNSGNYYYTATFASSMYRQTNGIHNWFNAPSGTAGNPITFTQAMTLDASGNLGIGTSSPSSKFHVRPTTDVNQLTSNNGTALQVIAVNDASSAYVDYIQGAYNLIWQTASAERMRIDVNGNVSIGTASSGGKLTVAGAGNTVLGSFSGNTTSNTGADLTISRSGATNYGVGNGCVIQFNNNTTTDAAIFQSSGSGFQFFSSPLAAGWVERARIDATGNIQVPTGAIMPYAPTHTAISAATTLTNAQIQTQVINTTGTVTYAVTLPTGATLETLASWANVNIGYDFYIINTNTVAITVGANANTTLGSLSVAAATSAQFRIRRTAANTFTIYRLG